jgi:hypothetical protein
MSTVGRFSTACLLGLLLASGVAAQEDLTDLEQCRVGLSASHVRVRQMDRAYSDLKADTDKTIAALRFQLASIQLMVERRDWTPIRDGYIWDWTVMTWADHPKPTALPEP